MKANIILDILRRKHSEDTFVPECKDGPTSYGYLRMDAWVMKNSWANLRFIGYEIKVSRSDFLNDEKWRGYLNYCNQFYFVTSSKEIIDRDELPKEAGLIVASKNGRSSRTVKKSPFRDIEPPTRLLCYILMWRSSIDGHLRGSNNLSHWKEWLLQNEENRRIGYEVSTALRLRYRKDVEDVNQRISPLKDRIEFCESIEKILSDMGVDISSWDDEEEKKRKISDVGKYLTRDRVISLQRCRDSINEILDSKKTEVVGR